MTLVIVPAAFVPLDVILVHALAVALGEVPLDLTLALFDAVKKLALIHKHVLIRLDSSIT